MISKNEYLDRQIKATKKITDKEYDGLLIWSRGGSTQDRYAEVFYYTGFYPQQPFIPDRYGHWRAQGHTALILFPTGDSVLFTDSVYLQNPQPVSNEIITTEDLIQNVTDVLKSRFSPNAKIAVFGGDVVTWSWGKTLQQMLPVMSFTEENDMSYDLRMVKTQSEIEALKMASSLGMNALNKAINNAIPGMTEAQIAAIAVDEIIKTGGSFYGMGLSSGEWAHTYGPSTPAGYSKRQLQEGDMLRIDIYGTVEGYIFDLGRSKVVGDKPSVLQQSILDAVKDSVCAGIESMLPGTSLKEVAKRCEEVLCKTKFAKQYGIPGATMGGSWGHAIGLDWGPPWIDKYTDFTLLPGMSFAVERRIDTIAHQGANYEENVIIKDAGAEIISV